MSSSPESTAHFPQIDDPLAQQICWKPFEDFAGRWKTRHLMGVSPDRYEIHFVNGVKGLIILPVIVAFIFFWCEYDDLFEIEYRPFFWFMTSVYVFTLLVMLIGVPYFYQCFWSDYYYLDKNKAEFRHVRPASIAKDVPDEGPDNARLKEIGAIQLIEFSCSLTRRLDVRLEMNLVLIDGRRIPLYGSADQKQMLMDAESLSDFLGVPVWVKTLNDRYKGA